MSDHDFQTQLNIYRRKFELKDVEYHKVGSLDDLKREGDQQVTFQQLIDTIQEELDAKKKFQIFGYGNNTSTKYHKHLND